MQEKFIGFKHPITSFGANKKISGIIADNVYRGFDTVAAVTGLNFSLSHTTTGERFTNLDQSVSPALGVWVTKQGVTIKEDAAIPLTLVTNANNAFERLDILVGRHYHDVLQVGGINASYEIIKGPDGGPVLPAIPNPQEATIIGIFRVAKNASSMASVVWERNRTPSLGGFIPAFLKEDNRYEAQNQDYQSPNQVSITSADFEVAARGTIGALNKANLFVVAASNAILDLLPNKPDGTVLGLKFTNTVTIRGFVDNLVGNINGIGQRVGYESGYRAISLENKVSSLVIPAGAIAIFQKVNAGGAFLSGANPPQYEYGDYWKLIQVSSDSVAVRDLVASLAATNVIVAQHTTDITDLKNLINNINPPRSLLDVDFIGDMNNNFDATGLAKPTSPYYGRAICNGQNGTPDFRGRMKVSYSDIDVDYNSVGFIGGNKLVTIAKTNLPNVRLNISYKWNDWRGTNNSANFGTMSAIDPQNPSGEGYNRVGQTHPLGDGTPLDARPAYKVTLTLMWVGIPTTP